MVWLDELGTRVNCPTPCTILCSMTTLAFCLLTASGGELRLASLMEGFVLSGECPCLLNAHLAAPQSCFIMVSSFRL